MAERRVFTDEFKREAVRLAVERGNVTAVARDLGIDKQALNRWKHRISVDVDRPFPGHGNPQNQELVKLQREVARLREDNEILKKAVGIFTTRPR